MQPASLPELLEALDAVGGRIADMRWSLEEGTRNPARLLARLLVEVSEAERELDDLRALLRAAERHSAAPPLHQPRPAERRRA